MKISSTSHLEIDLDRLNHNISVIRQTVGAEVLLCAVVKADAYGLGALPVASRLSRLGVDMLAVYTPSQARELVEAGIDRNILLLMPLRHLDRHDHLYRALFSSRLHCTVHDLEHLTQLIRIAESFGCTLPLHVEIDTGMSRGGMTSEEAIPVINRIINHHRLHLAGIFTQFTSADSDPEATEIQFRRFADLVTRFDDDLLKTTAIHVANTDACFRFGRRFHFDMVRLGLAWVGYGDQSNLQSLNARASTDNTDFEDDDQPDIRPRLLPIVRWTSTIVHAKWIEKGTPVGYTQSWKAPRRSRIGIIPIGYADGYPLSLSSRSIIRVRTASSPATRFTPKSAALGQPASHGFPPLRLTSDKGDQTWFEAPVIGRISMDQTVIDLTDLPEHMARVGTEVEILSDDPAAPNSLVALAELAGTIPYEILCGLSSQIPRRFLTRNQPVDSHTKTDHHTPSVGRHSLKPAPITSAFQPSE